MDKKGKTVTKSTKEELVMYSLLFVGIAAIASLFATNVILIKRISEYTVLENFYLRNTIDTLTRKEAERKQQEELSDFGFEEFSEAEEDDSVLGLEDEYAEEDANTEDLSNEKYDEFGNVIYEDFDYSL